MSPAMPPVSAVAVSMFSISLETVLLLVSFIV